MLIISNNMTLPMTREYQSLNRGAQVVELPVLHPGQERLDLGASVDKGWSRRVPGVAHRDSAVT